MNNRAEIRQAIDEAAAGRLGAIPARNLGGQRGYPMKTAVLIARILLGIIFVVFGLNGFLQFLPQPEMPPAAVAFLGGLAASGFMLPTLFATQLVGGALLLLGMVPLGVELRSSVSELLAEHRQAALGFGLRRLVLKYIPVLGENAVGDAADVRGDPGARPTIAGEAAVDDDVVAAGGDHAGLVPQRRRQAADEIEQAFAAGRDVGAVLDVIG